MRKLILCICAIVIGATIAMVTQKPTYETVVIQNAVPIKEKEDILTIASEILSRYHKDQQYNAGCTNQITPYLIMALIHTESKGNQYCKGKAGEIGLTQVLPKWHEKSLKSAGIIKDKEELWNKRQNIEAGIYILMHNAKNSQDITHALSKYNAGKVCPKGLKYSKRVLATAKGDF